MGGGGGDMVILENGYRKTKFSRDFVVLKVKLSKKTEKLSNEHMPSPNAH